MLLLKARSEYPRNDGDLKLYGEYLRSIKNYIKAIKWTLSYEDEPGEAACDFHNRCIYVDTDLNQTSEISALLHELGHVLDDALMDDTKRKKVFAAHVAFHNDKADAAQRRLVIFEEKKAWSYGEAIARQLKIKLGKWYFDERDDSLKGYVTE